MSGPLPKRAPKARHARGSLTPGHSPPLVARLEAISNKRPRLDVKVGDRELWPRAYGRLEAVACHVIRVREESPGDIDALDSALRRLADVLLDVEGAP